MFDPKTIMQLGFYVYCLIDPRNDKPFYIGKGKENRVFQHVTDSLEELYETDKIETIRSIRNDKLEVKHTLIRHGLKEPEAFMLESALIDTLDYLNFDLTNKVKGHHSIDKGLMTTDELIGIYNAETLNDLGKDAIIININLLYEKGSGYDGIYNAIRESWPLGAHTRKVTKYVLAEYRGLIVEVFELIGEWYPVPDRYKSGAKKGQERTRWGFKGKKANNEVRELYINKSISHHKKRGAANPVRCNLKK